MNTGATGPAVAMVCRFLRRRGLGVCRDVVERATVARDLPGFGSVLSALFGDRVQSPLARDAFELVQSSVVEADPRPGHEILDRA